VRILASVFLAVLGCSEADPASRGPASESTGSTCPNDSTLSYSGWAQGFFASYCTRCHSSELTSRTERHGATIGANWDDLEVIREYADEIDAQAAGGPKALNELMPPDGSSPTAAERRKLGEWLACGAPL
jgi:uncharacterized membrane protein